MTVSPRLANPVALEAVIQLRRHLLKIRRAADYNHDILEVGVNVDHKNLQNAGASATRPVVVNVAWDLDSSRDMDVTTRTNGITSWTSTVMLSAFLHVPDFDNDPAAGHRARTLFHADLCRYFYPLPGQANTAGEVAPWCLPTEIGQKVIREFYIARLNHDPTFENRPIIKVDLELSLYWAALVGDLYYPK